MEHNGKPALGLAGGSALGAFQLGTLFLFNRLEVTIEDFCLVNGTSIGGINATPLGTKQVVEGGQIWTNGSLHGRLFQLRRLLLGRRPLNLPLVMQLFKTVCPVDRERLRALATPLEITVTSCTTGITHYVDARTTPDIYRLLTTTAALPLVHGPVYWEEEDDWRMDGGMGEEIPIGHILEHAQHAIIVLTWPKSERAEPAPSRLIRLAFPWRSQEVARDTIATAHLRYNAALERLRDEEASGRVTIVAPEKPMLGGHYLQSPFDMHPERIRRVIRHGYRCALHALWDHPLLVMARERRPAPA